MGVARRSIREVRIERIIGAHEGERVAARARELGLHYLWHFRGHDNGGRSSSRRDLYLVLPDALADNPRLLKLCKSKHGRYLYGKNYYGREDREGV